VTTEGSDLRCSLVCASRKRASGTYARASEPLKLLLLVSNETRSKRPSLVNKGSATDNGSLLIFIGLKIVNG